MRPSTLTRCTCALAVALAAVAPPVRAQSTPDQAEPAVPVRPEDPTQATPRLPSDAEFQRAVSFYDAGRYGDCAATLLRILGTERGERSFADGPQGERARVYAAACLIAEGRLEEADDQFRLAIRANPQMGVPSSVDFPQPVVDRFILVRSQMLHEIRRAQEERARQAREEAEAVRQAALREQERVARLERLAQQETVVVRNERWIASVPFGVGQFQNRKYGLGAFFLTSELLLAGTALTAVSLELRLTSQASAGPIVSAEQESEINSNIATARAVSLIATGGLLLTAIVGVTEAHLSFVPEFRDGVRERRTAPSPRKRNSGVEVEPTVVETSSGAGLGLRGTF